MRAGQQRNGFPRLGLVGQVVDQPILLGGQNFTPLLEHQRVREIIDVLGGAGEVPELAELVERRACDLLFKIIFDRFDVVVGGLFNILHLLRFGRREADEDRIELKGLLFRQPTTLGDARLGAERFQPEHLHQHAAADQSKFRKGILQFGHLRLIAPVERAQSGNRHKFLLQSARK